MRSLRDRIARASEGAPGTVLILSANPMHDTGGGQRSAQIALELLASGYCVVFVSHGRVTETVDLGLRFDEPRLVETSLRSFSGPSGQPARALLEERGISWVLTQIPVRAWLPVVERASASGAVTVYDCVDRWDSELGRGWYREPVEYRMAREADVVVASAPELVRRLERMAEREVHLLPNAFNGRVFDPEAPMERPADLPEGRVALYVGALWGGWLDWELVGRTASACPDTSFVFVGDHREEGAKMPGNCVFLGLKPQTALPPYLAHADLAFLPWTQDEVTHATSPLKVYEFVAMGLPVVAPRLNPLDAIPGVTLVDDPEGFAAAVREVDRESLTQSERRAMRAFSDRNSWERRVAELEAVVDGRRVSLAGSPVGPVASRGPDRGRGARSVLSVVVPSFNHARFIDRAIDSVRDQTLAVGDMVVVDDGSTDDSLEVLAGRSFAPMRVVRQENRGAHEAINRAIALSEGEYVAILNSDDFFEPERLEHAWGVARASGAALVVGGVRWVDEAGESLPADHAGPTWYRKALSEWAGGRSARRALLRHNVAVTTSNFFMHRALWRALGGFRAYRYVHDLDFLLRAVELCGDRVVIAPDMVDVAYRVHGANTISESTERAHAERRALVRALGSPLGRVRRLASRSRLRGSVVRAVGAAQDLRPLSRGSSGPRTAQHGRVVEPSPPRDVARKARTLRVGLVVHSLGLGGLEEVLSLLARALPAQGVVPSVLCTHGGGPLAVRLERAGVSVTVGDGRPASWRAWLHHTDPELVSTHFADPEVVEVLAEAGMPIVETIQNTYAWFDEARWAVERAKTDHLSATIAVSDIVAEHHARHVGTPVTPHVVPNAVDPARAASVPRSWARRLFGLGEREVVLVHHGRLARQKNLVGLVRAFAEVAEVTPEAKLVLAGPRSEPAYARELKKAAPRAVLRDRVRWLPPVPHVGALLSAADLFVSNSFFEGWSVAASEASWVGLPLVLSECGGSRELIGPDGRHGRLVPNPLGDPLAVGPEAIRRPPPGPTHENERALAEALRDVIGAREAWQGRTEERRRDARARLGPEPMARRYAEIFRSVLGGGS